MTIPPKTQRKLFEEHPEGTRHKAKIEIAMPLIGEGLPVSAVVETLRQKFPQAEEKEIVNVVNWCVSKNPSPCARNGAGDIPARISYNRPQKPSEPKITPQEAVDQFINGNSSNVVSPVEIGENETIQLFEALYKPNEYISIVCKFTVNENKQGEKKANPIGAGAIKKRDEWTAFFKEKGVPRGDAGAWMRPNPVKKTGSGKDGAPTDADITDLRFMLLEFDKIEKEKQIPIYIKTGLPISAILDSGGKSFHAWIRMDSKNPEEHAVRVARIYDAMASFDLDASNKNASRLSRLVGSARKIGARGDGRQNLVYLNPDAGGITDRHIEVLERRVKPKRFKCKPMSEAVWDAIDFYQDLYADKSKSGLKTGFKFFDSITGGLKRGWLTIVAGETNAGKTSYVLNMIMNVLNQKKGVALFSFEMDQQEIIDIMFSREADVNRNHFNNGYFDEEEFSRMSSNIHRISEYPLHTFDDPLMTVTDVMTAVENISDEHEISLVVIDYLQLANTESFKDSREQQVAYVSRMSKAIAKKFKVPVIGVSQLNEDGKVRESRGIAHDANCIIKLIENDDGTIEGKVIKGRSIPKGSYYYSFDRQLCKFNETGCDDRLIKLLPKDHPEKTFIKKENRYNDN